MTRPVTLLAIWTLGYSAIALATPVPDRPLVISDMWHVDSALTAEGLIVPCNRRSCNAYWHSSKGWRLSISRHDNPGVNGVVSGVGFGAPEGGTCAGEVKSIASDAEVILEVSAFLQRKLKECGFEVESVPDLRTVRTIVQSGIWNSIGN